jgi:DNA-binding Lrp family transcriptional regulator
MSQEQGTYKTDTNDAMEMMGVGYEEMDGNGKQSAAVISSPRMVRALRGEGLVEYKAWGWVKISSAFISHIKILKGAKLSIWQTMALSIDENGECRLSVKEIARMTGYSRSEVIESQKELDAMGYLSVTRESGKKNIYKPEFAARGFVAPTSSPAQKNDQSRKTTSPVVYRKKSAYQSSRTIVKSVPSIKRVKRVKEGAAPSSPFNSNPPKPKATDFPAVVLYREVTEFYPVKACWNTVVEAVAKVGARLGRDATKDDLTPFYVFWCGKGWNPKSIDWLDYAIKGNTEFSKLISKPTSTSSARLFPKYVNGKAVFENV